MSTMRDRPQLWVFAGPNGAGKSTFVARHAVDQKIDVVNPDVIANRIDPSHKGDTAVLMPDAGRPGSAFGATAPDVGRASIRCGDNPDRAG